MLLLTVGHTLDACILLTGQPFWMCLHGLQCNCILGTFGTRCVSVMRKYNSALIWNAVDSLCNRRTTIANAKCCTDTHKCSCLSCQDILECMHLFHSVSWCVSGPFCWVRRCLPRLFVGCGRCLPHLFVGWKMSPSPLLG